MSKAKLRFMYDDNGKKIAVVMPPQDFELIIDELEDFQDYDIVTKRLKTKQKTYSLEEVMQEILGKK